VVKDSDKYQDEPNKSYARADEGENERLSDLRGQHSGIAATIIKFLVSGANHSHCRRQKPKGKSHLKKCSDPGKQLSPVLIAILDIHT